MDTSFLFAGVHFDKERVRKDLRLLKGKEELEEVPSVVAHDPQGKGRQRSGNVDAVSLQTNRKRKGSADPGDVDGSVSIFKPIAASPAPLIKRQKPGGQDDAKSRISAEEAAAVMRKKFRIHVAGHDIPAPLEDFEQLKSRYRCKSYLLTNIVQSGYKEPTPIQRQAIPLLLSDRECLACAPTGSGKTLAFMLPILMKLKAPKTGPIRALVLCPTRELALQTARESRRLSEGKNFSIKAMTKTLFQRASLEKCACDILVSTPRRLQLLLKRSKIDLSSVTHLVLDEADKLFEMGFVKDIDAVVAACANPAVVRALFSATLPDTVEELARSIMHDAARIVIGERNSASQSVNQRLVFVGSEDGKRLALRQIFREDFEPPVIIFVQSKERAKELHENLLLEGINVDSIHGDRSQHQRSLAVENFQSGKTWVLVATDVVARGIDFKNINLVINFDMPLSTIDYVHRIGRAGRAGKQGKAVTLYTEKDAAFIRSIANTMVLSGSEVPAWILALPKRKYKRKRPPPRKHGGMKARVSDSSKSSPQATVGHS